MQPVTSVIKNFFKHEGFYQASHIAFCAILSLVPLILIAVAIVGALLGSSQAVYEQLVNAITQILPQGEALLTANLKEIIGQSQSFGVWGVILLLFIATLLFGAIERALDVIFEAGKSRNFFHSRFLAIFLMVVISLFFFLPTAVDLMTSALARYGFSFPLGDFFRGHLFFLLFPFLAFIMVIFVFPIHRIRIFPAVIGGLFFTVGLFIAKQIFRWYIVKAFDQYNLIYGSLTALILLLLWIYYVSNILLLSAEIVAYLQFKKRFVKRRT